MLQARRKSGIRAYDSRAGLSVIEVGYEPRATSSRPLTKKMIQNIARSLSSCYATKQHAETYASAASIPIRLRTMLENLSVRKFSPDGSRNFACHSSCSEGKKRFDAPSSAPNKSESLAHHVQAGRKCPAGEGGAREECAPLPCAHCAKTVVDDVSQIERFYVRHLNFLP